MELASMVRKKLFEIAVFTSITSTSSPVKINFIVLKADKYICPIRKNGYTASLKNLMFFTIFGKGSSRWQINMLPAPITNPVAAVTTVKLSINMTQTKTSAITKKGVFLPIICSSVD
jgi:type IV pilus biogenesis protein CpaD/CtpE